MIDFCVVVSAPNVDVLFRLFFGSLQRHSALNDVCFHILDRGCNDAGLRQVRESLLRYPHTIYSCVDRNHETLGSAIDVAGNCDWMVNNCGTSKWVVISHFDIVFKKDFLGRMVQHMSDDVALIGQHCAIMAVNREAYKQSRIKFRSMGGFVAQPIGDGSGEYRVRHSRDPRVKEHDGSVTIRGFDIGQLLELEMRNMGWKVHPLTVWLEEGDHHEWYDHHGGGGSHWGEPYLSMHRNRALKLIEEGGY